MIVQSRRGLAYSRSGLSGGIMPTEARKERSELETYVDSHETGPGIWKWQHYLPIYERHFAKFQGTDVHVVEIGIYSGGSLDMWKKYFGPRCHIYGIDIAPECRSYASLGVDIHIGDQADPSFWQDFVNKVPQVDIVIDDGGHQAFQQIATLEALLPHIRPGGVYLCEDITKEYNPFFDYLFGLSRGLHAFHQPPTACQQAIDSILFYPYVCVIEKRADRLEKLFAPKRGSEWQPEEWMKAKLLSQRYGTLKSR
jgi:hypothetical protein